MPCGRDGAGGTSPAAIRSVQSANTASARSVPRAASRPRMFPPFCPDSSRRSHAATDDANVPSDAGISRVAGVPIEWQTWQFPFISPTHSSWLLMAGRMPLPVGPVLGKSLFGGTRSSESQ